jgi:hypothetical protein
MGVALWRLPDPDHMPSRPSTIRANGPQLKSSELLRQGFPDKTSHSRIWLSTKQPLFNAAFARAQVPTLSFYPAARAAQPVT